MDITLYFLHRSINCAGIQQPSKFVRNPFHWSSELDPGFHSDSKISELCAKARFWRNRAVYPVTRLRGSYDIRKKSEGRWRFGISNTFATIKSRITNFKRNGMKAKQDVGPQMQTHRLPCCCSWGDMPVGVQHICGGWHVWGCCVRKRAEKPGVGVGKTDHSTTVITMAMTMSMQVHKAQSYNIANEIQADWVFSWITYVVSTPFGIFFTQKQTWWWWKTFQRLFNLLWRGTQQSPQFHPPPDFNIFHDWG